MNSERSLESKRKEEQLGELARIYMTWWDKELLEKLKEIGIDPILYKRYVDDIVIIVMKIIEEYELGDRANERTI